ncbi:MAG: hypothetical protein KBD21_03285 [Candidatus Pacebacteria bacterium]|nr:hypothetical protein [Candidatus Paceibacterota bacterium]
MDGVLRCSRYAFGPNRLHFCGPDANREIWDYVNAGYTDFGLQKLLKGFEALYPYLQHIAVENHLTDPLDPRVVEAYWLGNELLAHIEQRALHRHLTDTFRMQEKFPGAPYRLLESRIGHGLLPNHNHHVLNVPHAMGFQKGEPDIPFMDSCRVSWGTVTHVSGPHITLQYEPLLRIGDLLALGAPIEKKIIRRLEADYDIEMLAPGHIVTMHWDIPCEVITEVEADKLRRYTSDAIRIANIDRLT